MDKLVCIQDFCEAALEKLDKNKGDYFKSGADDEITVNDNRNAFLRWLIRPRMLRDVSKRDLSTSILGKRISFPLGISPVAFQKTAHPDGEYASAKAAEAVGAIFTLSFFATSSMEEIAIAAPNGRKWMQLFIHKDRSITLGIIRRAEAAGFEAIVITVDAQYVGKRRPSRRDPFVFPEHLRLANVAPNKSSSSIDFIELHNAMDFGLTWTVIKWLKTVTKLPIIIKGIQTSEDALIAVNEGADAVWISNHGGRQIDTASATIDILPEIARAVNKRCEIFIDSGVTRGSDIFKTIALGANMVFIGRAIIWGITVDGEKGARKCLQIFQEELDMTMALSGTPTIKDITDEFVTQNAHSRL